MFQVIVNPNAVLLAKGRPMFDSKILLIFAIPYFKRAETLARKGELLNAFSELRQGFARVPGHGFYGSHMRAAFRTMWMACEHWAIDQSASDDPIFLRLREAILIDLQSIASWTAFNPGELDIDRLALIHSAIARCYK